METPRLTDHARERCAEMGISTKVAKRIVQQADLVRPCSGRDRSASTKVATSRVHPEYAVLFDDEDPRWPLIVTVFFNTTDDYVRKGKTFEVAS